MKETILALEKAAMERWRSGDPWGWSEISAENVIYVDPSLTRPIVGLEEYQTFLKQVEGKIHYQGSEFIDPRVVVIGDAAVLSYNYLSSALAPDGTILSQTPWNATEVYFRLDGEWKIVHTHWSYVQHQRPELVEVPVPVTLSGNAYNGVLGEVMALEAAAMERWRKGDPGGFIEICAPEVTYFDRGTSKRINGLGALKAEYTQVEGQVSFDVMDFIAPEVRVCGDMAALVYRFMSTRLNPDGSVSRRTPWNCSEVFVHSNDRWRIVHTHWSFIKGERMSDLDS
jgi:ketosteroid isomerase-like protein